MTEQATNSMPPAGKPFWKKKRWWVVTLFLLWIVWVYTIPRFPFEPYTLYSDMTDAQRENPIPFNQLVSVDYLNSDESPYKPGRAPLPKPPQEAIERYPGVRSCLVASEQQKPVPDLRLIDWDGLEDRYQVKLCVWWIFASLGTPERTEAWLKFHDFKIESNRFLLSTGVLSTNVIGHRSYNTQKPVWPTTGVLRFTHWLNGFVHSESIYSTWNNDRLRGTGFSHRIK